MKISITVENNGVLYESDEGKSWDDVPEITKSVKKLVEHDIRKELKEDN